MVSWKHAYGFLCVVSWLSSSNHDSFTSFPIWIDFIYFSSLIAKAKLSKQSWIRVAREDILLLFQILEEMLSVFHHWEWCLLLVCHQFSSVNFSHSVVSDICDPMDCSTPGFAVHHQLPELTQTHVHRVGDAIQPSHSLSSPSPYALNLSSIRVFSSEWVLPKELPKVAKVLEFPLQHESFQRIFRTDFL